MLHYRVVLYETNQILTPKFNSWKEADNYIFSFEPPIHAYITLIEDEINEKQKETNPMYEAWRKQRGDWGNVNPMTKIIPNKKKENRLKHPKRNWERKD